MEYIHNHIFTGFGWGSIGYTQWRALPVAQLASIGSVYSVSFFVVAINILICMSAYHFKKKPALSAGFAAATIILGIAIPAWGKMHMREPDMSSSLRVGVIQPNFSLDVKWSSEYKFHTFRTQRMLTDSVAAERAELVVWPESALYGFLIEERHKIAEIVQSHDVFLLMGSNHYEHAKDGLDDIILYYNSAFLIDPDGKVLGKYDKRHLAPFGEYVPLAGIFPFIDKVVPQVADFTPGKDITVFDIEGKKFCVVICFENSFPHLVRKSANRGVDFLVQLTNDGWFGHSAQPKQDLAIAVFRAIENGTTLVRGTNTGISCFIDPWGRISGIVRTPWDETVFIRGTSVESISTVAHSTFYKAYGDVWVLGCCLLLVAVLGMCMSRRGTEPSGTEKVSE
jgi:apolipoprotein N-acyltransferase